MFFFNKPDNNQFFLDAFWFVGNWLWLTGVHSGWVDLKSIAFIAWHQLISIYGLSVLNDYACDEKWILSMLSGNADIQILVTSR